MMLRERRFMDAILRPLPESSIVTHSLQSDHHARPPEPRLYSAPTAMQTTDRSATDLFLEFSRHQLIETYWPRMRECVESLSDDQIWWRPNHASNSIGNLLLHLNGNVHQWLVASFRGLTDERDRPAEFAQRDVVPTATLVADLAATIAEAADVLSTLSEADLLATFHIQGYTVTGLEAVYQVVEHFAMHYGQVVFITKQLRDVNLGFYRQLDATGRVEP